MAVDNETLVRRYFEELLSAPGQLHVADEILAADVIFENPISRQQIKGIAEYRAFALRWYEGFPDRKFTLGETVSSGDRIAARFTITGTHQGVFGGAAPSQNRIEIHGMNLFHTGGGKIRYVRAFFNPLELWRPLGLSPALSSGKVTPEQVKAAVANFANSFVVRDRVAFLALFADDAVLAVPVGTPPIMGKTALAAWFDGLMNSFETFDFTMEDSFVAGNEAALVFSIAARQGANVTTLRGVDVFAINGQGKIMSLAGYR
jgi:predicted ester cyclase